MLKNFREDRWLIFYVAVTLGILFTFNTSGGARYVFGIFPVLIYFTVAGLKFLKAENISRGLAFVILSASLIFDVAFAGIFPNSNAAFSVEARQTYNYINKNIGAEDLRLADYLLVTEDDWYSDLKSLAQNSAAYELIFENEKFKLYKIRD